MAHRRTDRGKEGPKPAAVAEIDSVSLPYRPHRPAFPSTVSGYDIFPRRVPGKPANAYPRAAPTTRMASGDPNAHPRCDQTISRSSILKRRFKSSYVSGPAARPAACSVVLSDLCRTQSAPGASSSQIVRRVCTSPTAEHRRRKGV